MILKVLEIEFLKKKMAPHVVEYLKNKSQITFLHSRLQENLKTNPLGHRNSALVNHPPNVRDYMDNKTVFDPFVFNVCFPFLPSGRTFKSTLLFFRFYCLTVFYSIITFFYRFVCFGKFNF